LSRLPGVSEAGVARRNPEPRCFAAKDLSATPAHAGENSVSGERLRILLRRNNPISLEIGLWGSNPRGRKPCPWPPVPWPVIGSRT